MRILQHPSIIKLYEIYEGSDHIHLVMEYVKGKTLKQIIREEGRLNTVRTTNLAIQIARALDCAHKNNIIHRDIKPHNILVTEEELVKVTDFGIAKASNSVTITNSSKIMGSAHYFSPEQAKGSFVDCRTDIYSLGIVIYEMATGRVPYDAESPVSVALKHIQEPVLPPKELNSSIPESLNKLILKAVEKEPIKRYQTIKDMLLDLRKIENKQEFNIHTNDLDDDMTRIMDPIVLDDKYERKKDGVETRGKNKKGISSKNKKTIMGIAIAVLFIVLGVVCGYFAFSKMSGASVAETTVPNIVGMNQDDAKKAVEDKKLKFVSIGKEKSDKPAGTVLRTYPDEGTKVKINSEVRVSISGGQDNLGVPNLIGVDLASAKDIITNSGLKLGSVSYSYSDGVPQDSVISQSPDPDSNAGTNTPINLVVSKGPEVKYTTVPDVSGKGIDEASALISNAGLKVSKTAVTTSDKSQDGMVSNQSVSPSQQVKEGTTVTLSYYKYKEPEQKPATPQNGDDNQQPGGASNGQPNGGSQPSGGTGQNNGGNTGGNTGGNAGGTTGGSTGSTTSGTGSGQKQTGGTSNTAPQNPSGSSTGK